MEKILLRYKWPTLLGLIFISLVLAPFAGFVQPNNSPESLSVIGDPAIDLMARMQKIFGNNEFVIFIVETDDILSAKNLQLSQQVSKDLLQIDGVRKVDGITDLTYARSYKQAGEEVLDIGPLIKESWIKTGVPETEKKKILNTQPYERLYFNESGTVMTFVAELTPLGTDNQKRDKIIRDLTPLVERYQKHFNQVRLTGMPVVDRFTFGVVERERFVLTGILVGLSALILWVIYRRASLVALPLGLMSMVMIWIMAYIYFSDRAFSWILTLAPVVILIVSVCDSIHIINCYLKNLHLSVEERIRTVVKQVGLPCFVTSVTTALGFFSIATSLIVPLRDFGIVVGIGVLLAFLISLIFLPIALSLLKLDQEKPKARKFSKVVNQTLDRILLWNIKHPGRVILVSVLVFVFFASGWNFVRVDDVFMTMHKGDNAKKIIEDVTFTAENAGATSEFYFFMDPGVAGTFTRPDVLRKMAKVQERTEKEVDLIHQSLSLADLVMSLNQALHDNNPAYYRIPNTQAEVEQLLFVYSSGENGEELSSLVSTDYSQMRVRFFCGIADSAYYAQEQIDLGEKIAIEEGLEEYNFSISGIPLIMNNTLFYIMDSQVMSLGLAFLTITLVISLQFRSLKLGLFSLIPNAAPIIMTMGLIGWSGIYLGVAVSMVAAVALGVAVDDTIHMLWAFKKGREEGLSNEDSVRKMFQLVGPAVVNTSLILCIGFIGLIGSSTHPSTYFGLLLAAACFLALVYDLFLLPALLLKLRPLRRS